MDWSMPGFSVHHQLPELTQTHVHRVSDAIQPSHPLSFPSPAFNLSQHQGLSKWVGSSHQVAKVLELQLQHDSFQWIFRIDFLQDWLVWSPCCLRDSQEASPTPQFKSISFSMLSLLYGPALTSIHVNWKNHRFDYGFLLLSGTFSRWPCSQGLASPKALRVSTSIWRITTTVPFTLLGDHSGDRRTKTNTGYDSKIREAEYLVPLVRHFKSFYNKISG